MLETTRELGWGGDPLEVLARWPEDRGVALLHSGRRHERWARYSILAEADGGYLLDSKGSERWVGKGVSPGPLAGRPFTDMRQLFTDRESLWIGYLAYDLGRWVEKVPERAERDRDWPVVELQRCPGWAVYDVASRQWRAGGTWAVDPPSLLGEPRDMVYQASEPEARVTREEHEETVARALEYIRAGDVFEVNLAQRFTAAFSGDPRGLFARLSKISPAWYGAYIESLSDACRAVCSISPELFLEVDHGKVITRPIKGTRPANVDPAKLLSSEKDTAELNMVVDMLRNDLGRVCDYGSIDVAVARAIETHPTVHHGVATITGKLHPSRDMVDLLRAAFPGGSITGAPKVRAMELIDELESVRRGPYCGAIGWVRGDRMAWNIAIRTMLVDGDRVDYSVGGGIVADSDPTAEYQETLDKAAAIRAALTNDAVPRIDLTRSSAIR